MKVLVLIGINTETDKIRLLAMHEYSLCVDIIEIILNEASKNSAKVINKAKIKLDPFVNANITQLEYCLRILSENTIAKNTKFIFEYLDIVLECKNNHIKNIKYKPEVSSDTYTLIINLSKIKCPTCNETMNIKNEHNNIYVESIDID